MRKEISHRRKTILMMTKDLRKERYKKNLQVLERLEKRNVRYHIILTIFILYQDYPKQMYGNQKTLRLLNAENRLIWNEGVKRTEEDRLMTLDLPLLTLTGMS